MKALILVDVQNDFLPGGALPVPEGDAVVPVANRVQAAVDLIVATQDWHPANHGSFAANHPHRKPGEVIELGGLTQVLWPVHCVQNTGGAAFAPGLETRRITRIFPKGTDAEIDSYSGFFDNGHKQATGLGDYLRARGVTDVYVLGLATDYCVKATALDARDLGFATHLIVDGCRGVNLRAGDVDRAIDAMRVAGVRVVQSDDLSEPGARPAPLRS
jgi:nicotinamidase/pyrazinamidase